MADLAAATPDVIRGFTSSDRAPLGLCECDTTATVTVASFSTPIPAFASQIFSSGETIQVSGGSAQTLANTRYYYFVSSRSSATSGQSLLRAIKDLLEASLGGVTWTVVLTKVGSLYKIQISHNSGSSKTFDFGSSAWALALGFAGTNHTVNNGVTLTADYPSFYWWTPDMPISLTGPEVFDPAISYGIPESAGAAQRSPDMTAAYVQNGFQWSADYMFTGVQYYYKIRPQTGHANEDLETWWRNGAGKGARFLMWRNRDNATGSSAPSGGSASPYNYIEYTPNAELRAKLPAGATNPPNLVWWNVTMNCWVTENGEAILS